ncbi:hypothetical protein ACSBR1_016440 [Camellia fascicularis]
MAISDEKQKIMPMPEDILPDRSKQLIVPESVLLTNPINPDLKGEVNILSQMCSITYMCVHKQACIMIEEQNFENKTAKTILFLGN